MDIHRYNWLVPKELFNEIQEAADGRGTDVANLLRRFAKLGLIILKASDDEDSEVVIRKNGKETIIKFL